MNARARARALACECNIKCGVTLLLDRADELLHIDELSVLAFQLIEQVGDLLRIYQLIRLLILHHAKVALAVLAVLVVLAVLQHGSGGVSLQVTA